MRQSPRSIRPFKPTVLRLESKRLLAILVDTIVQADDFVGQEGVGPDGLSDIRVRLTNLTRDNHITNLGVTAQINGQASSWAYGPNPKGLPVADFIRQTSSGSPGWPYLVNDAEDRGDIQIAAPSVGASGTLTSLQVTFRYADDVVETVTAGAGLLPFYFIPNLPFSRTPTPNATASAGGTVEMLPQYTAGGQIPGQSQGDMRLQLTLPSGYTAAQINTLSLSDGTGSLTASDSIDHLAYGATIWSSDPAKSDTLGLNYAVLASGKVEIAARPIRNESGAAMTLTMVMNEAAGATRTFHRRFAWLDRCGPPGP